MTPMVKNKPQELVHHTVDAYYVMDPWENGGMWTVTRWIPASNTVKPNLGRLSHPVLDCSMDFDWFPVMPLKGDYAAHWSDPG